MHFGVIDHTLIIGDARDPSAFDRGYLGLPATFHLTVVLADCSQFPYFPTIDFLGDGCLVD